MSIKSEIIAETVSSDAANQRIRALANTLDGEPTPEPDPPLDPDPPPVGAPGDGTLPDFRQDTNAIVVENELIVVGQIRFTTLVVPDGRVLTLMPDADLIFMNVPIDTDLDPGQIGHGLLVQGGGRLNALGTPCRSYSRATSALFADDDLVLLRKGVCALASDTCYGHAKTRTHQKAWLDRIKGTNRIFYCLDPAV